LLLDQKQEKRKLRRQRVLKSGVILFNNGYSSLSCNVKNMSEQGALLECETTVGIPNKFDLRMREQNVSTPSQMIWSNRTQLGVDFKDCK